jgi:hypothetical protein
MIATSKVLKKAQIASQGISIFSFYLVFFPAEKNFLIYKLHFFITDEISLSCLIDTPDVVTSTTLQFLVLYQGISLKSLLNTFFSPLNSPPIILFILILFPIMGVFD